MNKGYSIGPHKTLGGERFRITISHGFDASGRRKRTTKLLPLGTTKTDAHKEARILVKQKEEGTMAVANAKGTVAEYLREWHVKRERILAPGTWRTYYGYIENHIIPHIGAKKLSALTREDLSSMYSAIQSPTKKGTQLSGTTCVQIHRIIRKSLQDAFKSKKVVGNVADLVEDEDRPKNDTPEMQTFSAEELNHFLEASEGTDLGLLYCLDFETGMRRSEVCGLRWSDIDLNEGTVFVQRGIQRVKGKGLVTLDVKTDMSRRRIRLSDEIIGSLRAFKATAKATVPGWNEWTYVFTHPKGGPRDPDRLSESFRTHILALGMNDLLHVHSMRHTFASIQLNAGTPLTVVQDMLGHTDIGTTKKIYAHSDLTQQEGARNTIAIARANAKRSAATG